MIVSATLAERDELRGGFHLQMDVAAASACS
jgi:hypothetical protein